MLHDIGAFLETPAASFVVGVVVLAALLGVAAWCECALAKEEEGDADGPEATEEPEFDYGDPVG